jgi:hypothetical protein
VGEAEKGEGFWTSQTTLSSSQGRQSAKLDEASLLVGRSRMLSAIWSLPP